MTSGAEGKYSNVYMYSGANLTNETIRSGLGTSSRYFLGNEVYGISGNKGLGLGSTTSIGNCYINIEADLNSFTSISFGSVTKFPAEVSVDNKYSFKIDTAFLAKIGAALCGSEASQSPEGGGEYEPIPYPSPVPQPSYGY